MASFTQQATDALSSLTTNSSEARAGTLPPPQITYRERLRCYLLGTKPRNVLVDLSLAVEGNETVHEAAMRQQGEMLAEQKKRKISSKAIVKEPLLHDMLRDGEVSAKLRDGQAFSFRILSGAFCMFMGLRLLLSPLASSPAYARLPAVEGGFGPNTRMKAAGMAFLLCGTALQYSVLLNAEPKELE
eukprot:TRINITY_DN8653_c0_g1_i1.p1 TRINITY_DN8653_c0_g1~~TRINITY_DN8653_c0_g1_i1.p1  ORF type:complete len:212 (+),score=44.59 TRINITY_DN8653_c0_g1_i1:76-636(+)